MRRGVKRCYLSAGLMTIYCILDRDGVALKSACLRSVIAESKMCADRRDAANIRATV